MPLRMAPRAGGRCSSRPASARRPACRGTDALRRFSGTTVMGLRAGRRGPDRETTFTMEPTHETHAPGSTELDNSHYAAAGR